MNEIAQYKFEDTDRLKQVCDLLATVSKKNIDQDGKTEDEEDETVKLMEELIELIEVNKANCISICRMGGLKTLLELMIAHDGDEVRFLACRTFNTITASNISVQKFGMKMGCTNLAA